MKSTMDYPSKISNMNGITVIYDNRALNGLESGWGFSALVSFRDYKILFDAGGDGEKLLRNCRKLGIDLKEMCCVFLSHIHEDHTGGLWSVLEKNPLRVYLPASFPPEFKSRAGKYGAVVEISDPTEILPGIHTTGEMGSIREQAILLKTSTGLVVVTGCSHPGIVNIAKEAKKIDNVYLLAGGFHLLGSNKRELKKIAEDLKTLGVQKVMPCHCSGDRARKIFREEFGDNCVDCYAGKMVEFR